jgi:hypothetical protein
LLLLIISYLRAVCASPGYTDPATVSTAAPRKISSPVSKYSSIEITPKDKILERSKEGKTDMAQSKVQPIKSY